MVAVILQNYFPWNEKYMFNSPWTVIFIMSLFFVNCERTVLFSLKRDLDSPFTTLYIHKSLEILPHLVLFRYSVVHHKVGPEVTDKRLESYPNVIF